MYHPLFADCHRNDAYYCKLVMQLSVYYTGTTENYPATSNRQSIMINNNIFNQSDCFLKNTTIKFCGVIF